MSPPVRYHAEALRELLLRQCIATMDELKAALGTDTDLTVLRKLKELIYHTSYSHRGRYYTLDEVVCFDELGLWSFDGVWFSKNGTLIHTVEVLVETSEGGYFTFELESILKVSVKDALRKLFEKKRLYRERVGNRWLYYSKDPHRRERQLACRADEEGNLDNDFFPDELKAAIVIFFSLLDERKRRLYAGLESLKSGHGGDRRIASLLGLDEKTVARGRRELLTEDLDYTGVRKPGGGRRPLKKGRRK
ncbi:MAG: hypothetical protein AB1767_05680 [Bacillota bacterium]